MDLVGLSSIPATNALDLILFDLRLKLTINYVRFIISTLFFMIVAPPVSNSTLNPGLSSEQIEGYTVGYQL